MESGPFDLKKTVNLPRTDFSMKANLPLLEPRLLEEWHKSDLYGTIRKSRAGRPRYVLHDGPPYANGDLHLGHALNKILKDFIVKSKTMAGFDSPYIPGWDCHGLPIEIKVDSQLGSKKAQMTPSQIRKACRQYAQKYVDLQRKDFQRLGVLGRWDNPYLTMSPGYQAVIARAFISFFEKGYVYKGLKPVNWCISCRTALAEAEVEYANHTSPSIFVRFALTSPPETIDPVLVGKQVYGLIWTTTPWTIPANMAIAYNPKYQYVAVEVEGVVYLLAEGLLEETATNLGWGDVKKLAQFEGAKIEGAVFRHPFIERDSKGILGNHVTLEQGTGAVHTAPGHGADDYVASLQYGIPVYCPVDGAGRLYHTPDEPGVLPEVLIGKTVWDANQVVIDLLQEKGALLAVKKIDHSYPHCWRCHKPTIFRATEQWFIGMDRNNLRERALEAIHKIKWMPSWGEDRISNMIASRPDWCISRQRIWGVPIVAFHCIPCGALMEDTAPMHAIVDQFAEASADLWYEKTAAELLGPHVKCAKCGASDFRKENDILDVWFDSGSSHLAVLTPENDLTWPADMYLEGGDQYRGWFHSSLLVGVGLKGDAPYRESATHGWTLDEHGKAMSKSGGNGIEPDKIIKQFGADILRLWVSSVEFTEDVTLSDTILARLTEAYRKLRNTFRYALGNLADFDPATNSVPFDKMEEIDQWILVRAGDVFAKCRASYGEFAFHRVYQALYNFAVIDLSSLYFDVSKDKLYTAAADSHMRRSAQTALYQITHEFARMIAPMLSFTAEEVWKNLKKPEGSESSIHLAMFPDTRPNPINKARLDEWTKLIDLREPVLKALESARQAKLIGAPLEAKLTLRASGEQLGLLQSMQKDLAGLFIVSQVIVEPAPGELAIQVDLADGVKCERCWKYTNDVGSDAALPTACAACALAVRPLLQTT